MAVSRPCPRVAMCDLLARSCSRRYIETCYGDIMVIIVDIICLINKTLLSFVCHIDKYTIVSKVFLCSGSCVWALKPHIGLRVRRNETTNTFGVETIIGVIIETTTCVAE